MKKIAIIACAIFAASAISAYAGTTNSSYSTTVGAFNGNGYTGYDQTKDTGSADGLIESASVGGSYVVDARMQNSKGKSTDWVRKLDDNDFRWFVSKSVGFSSGDSMRVQFSNDLTTPVQVQVSGAWRSDY